MPRLALSPLQSLLDLTTLQTFCFSVSLVPLLLICTWISTTVKFRNATKSTAHSRHAGKAVSPAYLPYAVPWLGSTISFLDESPSRFWKNLRGRLGPGTDACTILLGGVSTYVLAMGSEALLKQTKLTDRSQFDEIVLTRGFGISRDDFVKFSKTAHGPLPGDKSKMTWQESLYHQYLLAPAQINVLTSKFVETFRKELEGLDAESPIDLVRTVRDAMFNASVTAFMGSKVLEMSPNWASDFWTYDVDMLKLFYGLPRFVSRDVRAALERLLDAGEKWHGAARENFDAEAAKDLDWEPWYGCRFIRARQVMYENAGLSTRGTVSPDIGFLFGLSSNAIPATTWMLCHLFTTEDQTLLPEVIAEVSSAQQKDGSLDINKLVQLPLLNSIYSETLRMYVDVLVTRTINQPFTLPSSHTGHPGYLMEKGNIAMAPSYLSHHDPVFWSSYGEDAIGPDVWHARRFLHEGKYSTSGTSNKLFPYGGGNHMCPGRVFAKQEILAAVAIVLLTFEIRVEEGETLPKVRRGYSGTGVVGLDRGLMVSMTRR